MRKKKLDFLEKDVLAVDLSESTVAVIECSKKLKIRACPNDICPDVVYRGDNEYAFESLETIHDGTVFSCGRKGTILRLVHSPAFVKLETTVFKSTCRIDHSFPEPKIMWLSASDQERISMLVDCSNPDDFMFDSCVEDKAPNCQGDCQICPCSRDLEIYDSGRKKALHCQVDYLSVYENRIVETSKTIYLRDPLWGKLDLNFLMDGEIRRNDTMIERIPDENNQSKNTSGDDKIAMGLPVTWILVIAGASLFLVCIIMVALGIFRRQKAQERMLKKRPRPSRTSTLEHRLDANDLLLRLPSEDTSKPDSPKPV
ncbi:unnamed protein product [Oikopleura dioica]|uniref:Uncharacterized protein n=1 Tax=Oikopleura dioica TaxID=34765 RepID=E4XG61_OIKDI|nr:unnamed protein product [Oikopleura dioica]